MANHIYSKKKYPITFNLIVFCNYVYIFFPRVDFGSSNFNKDDLKARSERKKKARLSCEDFILSLVEYYLCSEGFKSNTPKKMSYILSGSACLQI